MIQRTLKMQWGILLGGMVCLVSVIALSGDKAKSTFVLGTIFEEGEENWVSLTEGESLRGWKPVGDSDWSVDKGILHGTKGEILNRWCWVDFELKARIRGTGTVRFRVGSDQTGHIGFNQAGYWLDIGTGHLRTADNKSIGKGTFSSGKNWTNLSIRANHGKFTIKENGKTVLEVQDHSSPLKGRIGFIARGTPLEIDFLHVRALQESQVGNIPTDNYYCFVCHANFEDDDLVILHEEEDMTCASCHGPSPSHRSDEDNITPPNKIYRHVEVDPLCLQCHERHEEKEHPEGESLPPNPVCTDCHGTHRTWN